MTAVTAKNLLSVIKAYFTALGLREQAEEFFTAHRFTQALVLRLPAVCLMPGNKPADSRSKQTHIHVTGDNRYFFFPTQKVDEATRSSEYALQRLVLSRANLHALCGEEPGNADLGLLESYTVAKIATRAAQEAQVQISKIREDGPDFIRLRKALYEYDLLVFLKYRAEDKMMALGIPLSFYENDYSFRDSLFSGLESDGVITVRNALTDVMNEYAETAVISDRTTVADAVYQEMVASTPPSRTQIAPQTYTPPQRETAHTVQRPSTDPALGKEAICDNHYRCSVNPLHTTFQKKDGLPYMEVHHLIPMHRQAEFKNRLDTKANLIPLCPICHQMLHHGRPEEMAPVLTQLYEERRAALARSGISISLEKLLEYYS